MNPNEKKRHFLYYIFQIDRKHCMIEKDKETSLKRWFGTILDLLRKGETPDE